MRSIDNNSNSSSSSNKSINHYQEILLNAHYQPEQSDKQIRVPTIKRKYSPNLKFCNDGETVKYIKKPTTGTLIYSNFQTDYLSSRDDIIFYFEVEMLEMSDKSDICVGLGISTFPVHKQPGFSKKAKCSFGCKKNGEIRCSKIKSTQKIKSWGKGSIIGCGYNYVTNEIFFTNDGEYKGAAFTTVRNYSFIGIISLSYFQDKVKINFGQKPFKFDIRTLITDYQQQIEKQIKSQKVDVFEVHKLVQQYLYFNGYFDSLKSFEDQSLLCPISTKMECEEKTNKSSQSESEGNCSEESLNLQQRQEKLEKSKTIFSGVKQVAMLSEDMEDMDENSSSKLDKYQEEIIKNYERYENILDLSKFQEDEEDNFIKKKIRMELNRAEYEECSESNTKLDNKNNSDEEYDLQNQNASELTQQYNQGESNKEKNGNSLSPTQIKPTIIEVDHQTIFDNVRKEIIFQLQKMNYSKIIDLLQTYYPKIFESNPQLEGKLVSLQFIKMYKESKQEESIKYVQMNVKQMNDIKIEYIDNNGQEKFFTKLDILGAFCYENIENSHLSLLFQPYTQMKIWDEINNALLNYFGFKNEDNLQIIMKQINLILSKMKENEMFECAMYKM